MAASDSIVGDALVKSPYQRLFEENQELKRQLAEKEQLVNDLSVALAKFRGKPQHYNLEAEHAAFGIVMK